MVYKLTYVWIFVGIVTEVSKGLSPTKSCTYHGNTYHHGDAWVDEHVCDVCVCNEYGTQCYANLDGPCKFNRIVTEVSKGLSPTKSCMYHGNTYHHGDAWVDEHVCDVCVCNEYGTQCYANLDGPCKFNISMAKAGDHACLYGMTPYLVGDVFSVLDGCNKCLCTERGMQCTGKACSSSGFEKPTTQPLYGECMYEGHWYRFHTQWLAHDGCNTCFCYTIGNYRGGHVCTTSKCSCNTDSAPVLTG